MVDPNDWRLQGQEHYLQRATLHWSRWTRPRPNWDHDHCSFFWAKFGEEELPGALHFGYTTADDYYWICEQCFSDFKDQFRWPVEPTPTKPRRATP